MIEEPDDRLDTLLFTLRVLRDTFLFSVGLAPDLVQLSPTLYRQLCEEYSDKFQTDEIPLLDHLYGMRVVELDVTDSITLTISAPSDA